MDHRDDDFDYIPLIMMLVVQLMLLGLSIVMFYAMINCIRPVH